MEGFVDTPIGQGPATTLHSPRRFSDAGAIGGLLPLPLLTQPESDLEDRLPCQESIDLQHLIDIDKPNSVSTPNDDAASTSSIINEESGPVDQPEDHRDQLNQEASLGNFPLHPMETVQPRRIETMQDETWAARLARLEAHINGCILGQTSCEYYLEVHQTKLDWATNRINEDQRERDELTKRVDELSDLVVELTMRLNQGESKVWSGLVQSELRTSALHYIGS